MSANFDVLLSSLNQWSLIRKDALCPPFVAGLMKVSTLRHSLYLTRIFTVKTHCQKPFQIQISLRQQILHSLRDSVDSAASVLVILALLVFLLSTTIFITVNVNATTQIIFLSDTNVSFLLLIF